MLGLLLGLGISFSGPKDGGAEYRDDVFFPGCVD